MRCSLLGLATVLSLALTTHAAGAEDLPGKDAFTPGSGKVWLSDCEFEAERYVTCKSAAPDVLQAIAHPADGSPGLALQTFVSDVFIEKGCAFEAAPETFRVNGVFLSFDSKGAAQIRCKGKPSKLVFQPGVITFLDTLYFFAEGPPQ